MTVPLGVESGKVTWSVLAATQDTTDADRLPNFGAFRGAVLFTPSINSVRRLSSVDKDYTIFLDPVLGQVGDDGILKDLSGLEGVVLVSPFSSGIEETDWHWEVSFQLNQREKISFPIKFQPGQTVDLSRETPAAVVDAVIITKGEKGDNATVSVGTVTTGAPGSSVSVSNSGTPSNVVLDVAIPRGDVGPKPVIAGTSSTNHTPSLGGKTLATQAGLSLAVGEYVRIAGAGNPNDYMAGPITSYSGTSLAVNVVEFSGTGGRTDWVISLSGTRGAQGIQGIQGETGDLTPSGSGNWTGLVGMSGWTLPATIIRILTGNITIDSLPTNPGPTKSATVTIILKQAPSGGPYTVTWPTTGLQWAGGALAPLMPTTPSAELLVHLFWTGTAWRGFVGGVFQ